MSTLVTIQVNGQAVAVPPGQVLTTCLEQLGYDLRLVALEFNGEILHRQHWLHTRMEEGTCWRWSPSLVAAVSLEASTRLHLRNLPRQ